MKKKYNVQTKENQNHHQYCHWAKWIIISDFIDEKPVLKLGWYKLSIEIQPHIKNK